MSDCIFCRIVAGEIPSERIYEDSDHLAFMDIQPVNMGHVLVIPKDHYGCVAEMPEGAVARLFAVANRVALKVQEAVPSDGYILTVNNGQAAGQLVFHTHVHVIPRFRDDGLRHWGKREIGEGEIRGMAEKIREAMRS
ncbi:HIT family protein [Candidatus Uhrbacteria bacterium]|nr:HIT family protein [Candidatus Uhrbacteria bacterium]